MPRHPKPPGAHFPWAVRIGIAFLVAGSIGLYVALFGNEDVAMFYAGVIAAVAPLTALAAVVMVRRSRWMVSLRFPNKTARQITRPVAQSQPVNVDVDAMLAAMHARNAPPEASQPSTDLGDKESKLRRLRDHPTTSPQERALAEDRLRRLTDQRT